MTTTPKRILIVGGVAGGASCAARARRLSETAEICHGLILRQGSKPLGQKSSPCP